MLLGYSRCVFHGASEQKTVYRIEIKCVFNTAIIFVNVMHRDRMHNENTINASEGVGINTRDCLRLKEKEQDN